MCTARKQGVECLITEAVRVFDRGLQPHQIDRFTIRIFSSEIAAFNKVTAGNKPPDRRKSSLVCTRRVINARCT